MNRQYMLEEGMTVVICGREILLSSSILSKNLKIKITIYIQGVSKRALQL